ncbi:amidohydrolase family protein [Bacillus timonensis]|nr:amidohydrolase family protein [Bacillus timonensis]
MDCHFHIDETMLTIDKMIAGMDSNGVSKTALIPPMNETMFEIESSLNHYLQRTFKFMILNSIPGSNSIYNNLVKDGYFHLAGRSYKIFSKPDNTLVADALIQHPSRFLGWIAINPLEPHSLDELETYIDCPGFIGVKVHPFMHDYSIKELDQIADVCQSRGKPMLIHLSSERDSFKYLPIKFPKLKVIYAHAGVPFWRELWKFAKNQPSIFVDTSSDYINPSIVKKTVQALGFRKVLYGCDGPYGMSKFNEYDYSLKKKWIEDLIIPNYQKDLILGGNFLEMIE